MISRIINSFFASLLFLFRAFKEINIMYEKMITPNMSKNSGRIKLKFDIIFLFLNAPAGI